MNAFPYGNAPIIHAHTASRTRTEQQRNRCGVVTSLQVPVAFTAVRTWHAPLVVPLHMCGWLWTGAVTEPDERGDACSKCSRSPSTEPLGLFLSRRGEMSLLYKPVKESWIALPLSQCITVSLRSSRLSLLEIPVPPLLLFWFDFHIRSMENRVRQLYRINGMNTFKPNSVIWR